MIEQLKNTPEKFLSPFQKKLLEMATLGLITEVIREPETPEQIQQRDWDRRINNMKAGKSGLDAKKIHVRDTA